MHAQPSAQALAAMHRLTSRFFRRGLIIALIGGVLYGLYSAFLSQGMAVGVWGEWYAEDQNVLSAFTIIYVLGMLGSGVNDLISRAADVMLKEETKRLVICPRETPFSLIHLRNLSTIREAGGIVVPAIPAFYRQPGSIEELVDSVVVRLLAQVGLCPRGYRGWQEE